MLKKSLLSFVLLFVFAMPIYSASAESNEEEYRAYLFALIELLQQQVLLLTENQSNSSVLMVNTDDADFSSFLLNDSSEIEAWYILSKPGTTLGINNQTHKKYFSRFFDLVPDDYDDYFKEVLVFDERANDFDGFVETVEPFRDDTWRLGINEEIFEFSPNSNLVEELFIHEFSHIISYEGIPGRAEPRNYTCHEHFSNLGCPPANSYLVDFMDKFWTDNDLDRVEASSNPERIWTEKELSNNFVTDYAGTNPAEDFAESFTFFVLEGRYDSNELADDKINYFFSHDELVEMRETILSEL